MRPLAWSIPARMSGVLLDVRYTGDGIHLNAAGYATIAARSRVPAAGSRMIRRILKARPVRSRTYALS